MIQTSGDSLTMPKSERPKQNVLLLWLMAAAIALLPMQIELKSDLRLAPTDIILALTVLLGVGVWRGVHSAWSVWHIGLLSMFFIHFVFKNLRTGTFSQGDLVNKLGGMVVLNCLYICLTSLADSWDNVRWFLKVFVISVSLQNTVNCIAFLLCRYTGSDHPILMLLLSSGVDRLAGMLVDANAYGGLLAVAFAITLLGGDNEKPLLDGWLRAACLLSLSIGLLLTSSRSAWLGIGFLSLYAGIRSPRLFLVIVLIATAGTCMIALSLNSDSFDQFVTLSSRQNTIDERVEILHNAWEMFRTYPAFGAGLGAYFEEHGIIVHNSAMWFLAEFGVVGFLIFVGFMSWFIIKGVDAFQIALPAQRSIVAGLIAAHLAMLGLSLGIEATYQRHWWLVMGLLGASYTLAVQDAEKKKRCNQTYLPTHQENRNIGPEAPNDCIEAETT